MKTLATAATALALTAAASAAHAQARGAAAPVRPAAAAPAPAAAAPAAAPPTNGPPITGMCMISTARAIGQSSAGRAMTERLRQLVAQVQAELKPEADALQTEITAFQGQQAALTAEQRQTRAQALQTRISSQQEKADQRQRELQATEQRQLQRIGEQLQPVVTSLYSARQCAVLLNVEQAVLYANPAMDLTDGAIQQLNARFPTITFDRERIAATPQAAAPAAAPAARR